MTGDQLKALRGRHGLTQADLARVLRMSPDNGKRTVRRWEDGEFEIPFSVEVTLWALFEAQGCPFLLYPSSKSND